MLSLFINWNPSPEIFTIPFIHWPVRWYGLSWAMAFIGCHFFMNRIFKTEGRTEQSLDTLTLYIVIATILGARLGHCLFYGWEWYSQHPIEILYVWEGGLASHGGGIGISTATVRRKLAAINQGSEGKFLYDPVAALQLLKDSKTKRGRKRAN
jgi:prolipoprotein diacylglyceryltransferase